MDRKKLQDIIRQRIKSVASRFQLPGQQSPKPIKVGSTDFKQTVVPKVRKIVRFAQKPRSFRQPIQIKNPTAPFKEFGDRFLKVRKPSDIRMPENIRNIVEPIKQYSRGIVQKPQIRLKKQIGTGGGVGQAIQPTQVGTLQVSNRERDNFTFPDYSSSSRNQVLRADLEFRGKGKANIIFHFKDAKGKIYSIPQTKESYKGGKNFYGLELKIPNEAEFGQGEVWVTVNGKEIQGTRRPHNIVDTPAVERYTPQPQTMTKEQLISQLKPVEFGLDFAPVGMITKSKIPKALQGLQRANPTLFKNAQKAKNVDEFIDLMVKHSKTKVENVDTKVLKSFFNKVKNGYNQATKQVKDVKFKIKPSKQKLLQEPEKVRIRQEKLQQEQVFRQSPSQAIDNTIPSLEYKLKPEFTKVAQKNPKVVEGFVANRTMPNGTLRPAIREGSGVFTPKEFETFNFKDSTGLLGGQSYNLRDISLAVDNLTVKDIAKRGDFGPIAKLSYQIEQNIAEKMLYQTEQADKVRKIAQESGLNINKETGEQIFKALEGKTKGLSQEVVNASQKVRGLLDNWRGEANTMRKALGKQEIGYLEDYAPHLQKTSFWRQLIGDTKTTISDNFDYIIPNQKKNPHAFSREGQLKDLNTNAWELLDSYINSIASDMYTSPSIEQIKSAVSVLKGRGLSKVSNALEKIIREQLVGKPGQIDSILNVVQGTKKRAGLQFLMRARNVAALAGNFVWSVFVQPASTVLTTARAGGIKRGIQNTLGGMMDFSTDAILRGKINKLPTIISKTKGSSLAQAGMGDLDRLGTKIVKTRIEKANDIMGKFADAIEYWLTGSSSAAGYREAGKMGLKGKNADMFANWLGGATQSMYNKEARPLLMNNIAVRASFPFQTYAFELYRYVKTLAGRGGGLPLEKSERINQAIMLVAGAWLYGKYVENMTGRKINTLGSAVPIVGGLVDEGIKKGTEALGLKPKEYGSGRSPVAWHQEITNLISAVDAYVNKDNFQPMRKELVKWGMGGSGIGGSATVNRFIDGMIASLQGYQKTRSGNIAFGIRGRDKILAPLLGPYSTGEGKRYLQKEISPLSEKQSEELKSLPEEKREAFLQKIYLGRDEKRTKKEIKARFEGREEDKRLGIFDRFFNKTEAAEESSPLQDYITYYDLNDYMQPPTKDKGKLAYAKWKKKAYNKAIDILNDDEFDLSMDDKETLIGAMGLDIVNVEYLDLAKQENRMKSIFVREQIAEIASTSRNREDMLQFLVGLRREIQGKVVLTPGVINDLVDEGLLSKDEGKALKNLKFDKDGQPKVKVSGRGGSAKLKKVKFIKPKQVPFNVPTSQTSSIPSFRGLRVKVPEMLENAPNIPSLRVRGIQSPQFKIKFNL